MTNEKVLESVGESRKLVETIVQRKKNWIGHVLRGEGLLREVMEGKMVGKRPRGRPRIGMLEELKEGSFEKMREEQRIEKNGGVGCQGPAVRQNTNDDDDDKNLIEIIGFGIPIGLQI